MGCAGCRFLGSPEGRGIGDAANTHSFRVGVSHRINLRTGRDQKSTLQQMIRIAERDEFFALFIDRKESDVPAVGVRRVLNFTSKARKIVLFLLFFCIHQSFTQEIGADEGPFTIGGKIFGFKSGSGIFMALYSSQENFKKRKFTKANKIPKESVTGDTINYSFHGIKEGEYIIAAYQDINGDNKLNTNFAGIPTEPYLFYKSSGHFGWPSFANSKFSVKKDITGADLKFNIQK